MHTNETSYLPVMSAGYMPYVYARGIVQTYGYRPHHPGSSLGSYLENQAGVGYDFSSDRRLWSSDVVPQTVEQVIASGYFSVPAADPELALISDKRDVSRLGLDDVISQIRARYQVYERNMYELTLSMCEASNAVFRQEADQGQPADNRQQYSVQKQVQKLYEQQRDERVTLWRDVSRLRLALPETAQSYLTAHRKLAILNSTLGDEP